VLPHVELVMFSALALMETYTATIPPSSRLAVPMVLATAVMKVTSVHRMLPETLGAALMYAFPHKYDRSMLTTPGNVSCCLRCRIQLDRCSHL
jgi:hypothetical protein